MNIYDLPEFPLPEELTTILAGEPPALHAKLEVLQLPQLWTIKSYIIPILSRNIIGDW